MVVPDTAAEREKGDPFCGECSDISTNHLAHFRDDDETTDEPPSQPHDGAGGAGVSSRPLKSVERTDKRLSECEQSSEGTGSPSYTRGAENTSKIVDDATTGMKRRKIRKYKTRFAFFSESDDLCARRLDNTNPHEMLLMDKSTNCIWCCQLCSNRTLKKKHTREGFKTKYKCSVCDAALCKVPRFDGSSCFQLFHTSSKLFNPCINHRHKIYVRPHSAGLYLPRECSNDRFRLIDGFNAEILKQLCNVVADLKKRKPLPFHQITSTKGSLMQLKFNNEFHKLLNTSKRLQEPESGQLNEKFMSEVISIVRKHLRDVEINYDLVMATAIITRHGKMNAQQPPHMDYKNEVIYLSPEKARRGIDLSLRKHETIPWTGHMPITKNGRYLFLWSGPGKAIPFLIPYGKMLLIRGDVVHAGCLPGEFDHKGNEYDGIHLYLPNHQHDANQKVICCHDHTGKILSDSYTF
jgi:hypothetical protein